MMTFADQVVEYAKREYASKILRFYFVAEGLMVLDVGHTVLHVCFDPQMWILDPGLEQHTGFKDLDFARIAPLLHPPRTEKGVIWHTLRDNFRETGRRPLTMLMLVPYRDAG